MSFLLFLEVLLANAATRAAAIAAAAWLVVRPLARAGDAALAAACGFLLAMPLTHLLPEAMEAGADPHELGMVMLVTIVVFIIAGRLIGTGHVHEEGVCAGRDGGAAGRLPALFCAAALHNLVDGVLIATTFLVSESAGWLAALAVLAHELPQQTGYMVILREAGRTRREALRFCSGLALAAVLGGVAGLAAIGFFRELLPYALAMSSASFLFITLFGLLPEAFEGVRSLRGDLGRIALILAGIALSLLLVGFAHDHDHGHEHAQAVEALSEHEAHEVHEVHETEQSAHVDPQAGGAPLRDHADRAPGAGR